MNPVQLFSAVPVNKFEKSPRFGDGAFCVCGAIKPKEAPKPALVVKHI